MGRARIVFVNILFSFSTHLTFITGKGEIEPIGSYITDDKLTHKDAKQRCDMVGLENVVNVTSFVPRSDPVWIDASAKYTQWAEYDNTYIFHQNATGLFTINRKASTVTDIFRWCIENCNQRFFGLQDGKCACFSFDPETNPKMIKSVGRYKPCSSGTAICGEIDAILNFVVYKKVNITAIKIDGIGNCLTFRRDMGFIIRPCDHKYVSLCITEQYALYLEPLNTQTWIEDYNKCTSRIGGKRVSHSSVKKESASATLSRFNVGEVWLGNIRSFHEQYPSDENAAFCLAARIHGDGTVDRVVRNCNTQIPALCKVAKEISTDTKVSSNSDIQLGMIIVIVLASILGVVVLIVVALCFRCVRNKRKVEAFKESAADHVQSLQQNQNVVYAEVDKPKNKSSQETLIVAAAKSKTSTSHDQNQDVVYSMVNKPSKGVRKQEQPSNNATDQSASSSDIYDHAHQTPKKQFADDNNYDTMKNLLGDDENVYNTSNEKEESRVIIVDNDNEYSHAQFNDENDRN